MDIHITIDGRVIDLNGFFKEEMKNYSQCLLIYQSKTQASKLLDFIQKNIDFLTDNEDLYKAIYDLYERLAIDQKLTSPPSDTKWLNISPTHRDEYINASEAAKRKNVKPPSITLAAQNGKIAGHKLKQGKLIPKNEPGGRWKLSLKSVDQYKVNTINQQNRSEST